MGSSDFNESEMLQCVVCGVAKPHIREHFPARQRKCKPCFNAYEVERRARLRAIENGTAGEECECGNPKGYVDESCVQCAWLDGDGPAQSMISALRVLGEVATKDALIEEMRQAGQNDEAAERLFYRALVALRSSGRVASVLESQAAEYIHSADLHYVKAEHDPALTRNPARNHASRGGYYVHVTRPRSSAGGFGAVATHVLINKRKAG